MKRRLLLFLVVPILVLTITSCDADMRSNFAGFLGGFGGNIYDGLIESDLSSANDANEAIAGLDGVKPALGDGGKVELYGGVEIILTEDDVVLSSQSTNDQAAMRDKIKKATKTDDNKEKFVTDQKKPASGGQQEAAKGTVKAINATIDAIAGGDVDDSVKTLLEKLKLPEVEEEEITQADVLILQLMTDMISNTMDAIGEDGKTLDEDKIESLLNDVLFTVEIAETLSGASSISFVDDLNLFDLLPDGDGKSARAIVEIDDDDGVLEGIRSIFPSLIKLMGIKRSGNTYSYSYTEYQSFILNQRAYRASIEQAVGLDGNKNSLRNKAKFTENTLIKYLISVLMTQNHSFLESKEKQDQGNLMFINFLNANPKFGDKPTSSDQVTEFDDAAIAAVYGEDGFEQAIKDWGEETFRDVLENLKAINDNISDKYRIDDITDMIQKLLDKLDEGDGDWFDSVFGD